MSPNWTWNFVTKIFRYRSFRIITGHGNWKRVTDEIWNPRAIRLDSENLFKKAAIIFCFIGTLTDSQENMSQETSKNVL